MIMLGLSGTALSAAVTVMLATGTMRATTFAMAVVLFAVMNGLLGPSNDAMLKSLAPMDRFAKAQAIREARESCVELSGDAIGGLLYRIAGWLPFLASVLLYLASVFASLALPKREADGIDNAGAPSFPGVGKPSFLSQFVEGWRWTLTRRTVLAAIAQGAVMNVACYGSVIGVQIMLAERGTDAALIGLVGTATGVAALIGSLAAGWLVEHVPTGRLIILTFAVFTGAMLPLVFTDSYAAAVTCMAMASVLFPALNAGELGFIFGRTPDDMQGRVVHRVRDDGRRAGRVGTHVGRMAAADAGIRVPRGHAARRPVRRRRTAARLPHPDAAHPVALAMGAGRVVVGGSAASTGSWPSRVRSPGPRSGSVRSRGSRYAGRSHARCR